VILVYLENSILEITCQVPNVFWISIMAIRRIF